VLLIWRSGDEGAAAPLAMPLFGEDSKNIGLDASCDARLPRGVPFARLLAGEEAPVAALDGPAAALLCDCELRRLLCVGVEFCELARDERLFAGDDILAASRFCQRISDSEMLRTGDQIDKKG
jgi:hypothetical protein